MPRTQPSNAHSFVLKSFKKQAEFLQKYVPIDLLNDVAPSDIEDMTERFIPLFQDSKDSDTVKRVRLKNHPPLFVVTILEHQSSVNHRTSFRLLQYITLVLTEYEKEANKEKKDASAAKDFKYPPVLPIVFYDGRGRWTAEANFFDKTKLNNVFAKHIPRFEYEVVRLSGYSKRDLIRLGGALSLILLIGKIRDADGLRSLASLPPDYLEKLSRDMPPGISKLLADVITILLKRVNVPDDEIDAITDKIYEREVQKMFAWADNYDVQETRRIARAEGVKEGEKRGRAEGAKKNSLAIAKKALRMNMPIDDVVELTGLTREEVEGSRGRGE